MCAEFLRRILCAERVRNVVVPRLGVTALAQADCIVNRIGAAMGFLNDVMNVCRAPSDLMTNTAMPP
jgi:hypothetical protein